MKNFKFLTLIFGLFFAFNSLAVSEWDCKFGENLEYDDLETAARNSIPDYLEFLSCPKLTISSGYLTCEGRYPSDHSQIRDFGVLVSCTLKPKKACEKKTFTDQSPWYYFDNKPINYDDYKFCQNGCEVVKKVNWSDVDITNCYSFKDSPTNGFCRLNTVWNYTGNNCTEGEDDSGSSGNNSGTPQKNKCVKTEDGKTICNGEELPNGCVIAETGKKFCTSDLKDGICKNDLKTGKKICTTEVDNQDCIFNGEKQFCPENTGNGDGDANGDENGDGNDDGDGNVNGDDNGDSDGHSDGDGNDNVDGNGDKDGKCPEGSKKQGKICVPDSSVKGKGCDTSFVCKGDAVQCYVAEEMKKKSCKAKKDEEELNKFVGDKSVGKAGKIFDKEVGRGDIVDKFHSDVDFSSKGFSEESFLNSNCFPPETFKVGSFSFVLNLDLFCQYLNYISYVMVALGYYLGVRILMSDR